MKMRHELKYTINHGDYLTLKHRLSTLLTRDSHAGAHGEYRVRSLYFDTPGDHALTDKVNGVARREKFRIRCYDRDFSFIRLEKKIKINGLCAKKTAPLTKAQVESLLQGSTAWMLDSGKPLFIELYSKMQGRLLRPKTIVEYIREPFLFAPGNVRVTLDRAISTGLRSLDFFAESPALLETGEAYAVLEVKYDAFLPDLVAKAVSLRNRPLLAFSKYAACRKYD